MCILWLPALQMLGAGLNIAWNLTFLPFNSLKNLWGQNSQLAHPNPKHHQTSQEHGEQPQTVVSFWLTHSSD